MTTARAVVFHGPTHPLELGRYSEPTVGAGQIALRVVCCALCGSDLHTHAGRRDVVVPTVLGHEIVGRIAEFGPEAARRDANGVDLSVGDRVSFSVSVSCGVCFFCQNGLPQKCQILVKYGHHGMTSANPFVGGLADYLVLLPGTTLFRVPESLSDEIAAIANCSTATAAAVLRAGGSVVGRTVLVFGAGMLGVQAIAMARLGGADRVLVSDPRPAGRATALEFGATEVFGSYDELAAGVADATAGRGADIVLELAGSSDAVVTALKFVRIGGIVILAGTVSPSPPILLDPESVVRRLVTIRGVHNYAPADLAAALDFLSKNHRAYPFERLVVGSYRLDEFERAFAVGHANPGGRVVVRP